MKFNRSIAVLVFTSWAASMLTGCEKDNTAILALQDLTAEQARKIGEQSESLGDLAAKLETCQTDVAKLKEEPAIIKVQDVAVTVPALAGEPTIEALQSLQKDLEAVLAEQDKLLTEMTSAVETCQETLSATEAEVEAEAEAQAQAEAEAKAAAEAEAAKKAAAKKKRKAPAKPRAVREAEAQGKPTTGVRSRY